MSFTRSSVGRPVREKRPGFFKGEKPLPSVGRLGRHVVNGFDRNLVGSLDLSHLFRSLPVAFSFCPSFTSRRQNHDGRQVSRFIACRLYSCTVVQLYSDYIDCIYL